MIYLKNSDNPHYIGEWFEPDPIEEIAYRLSYINRFNGSIGPYSVAQHSVLVAQALPDELKLAGLLHDVCEAYLGDVTSPVKRRIKGYDELESFYCDVIDKHYGVEVRHPLVKEADLAVLLTEAEAFGMPFEYFKAVPAVSLGYGILQMSPLQAQGEFVRMYKRLRHGIKS